MQQLSVLIRIVFGAWIGLMAALPNFAAAANLTTPEAAVTAYIDGVIHQDFEAIIASTSADQMGKGFDFVAQVDRMRSLLPMMPAPASSPLFVEINKANFVAQIARQVQFLTYGLMTTSKILDGKTDMMDSAGAAEFASVVRTDRLGSLKLVEIGIPDPTSVNSKQHLVNSTKFARIYGAIASTDRVALVSFEGLHFLVGFNLLLYGDEWTVFSQSSAFGGTSSLGVPKRVTPAEFEQLLQ
ncbi:hypothetical protein OSH11_13880 [Kaistia dalseonensis]|uniref:Uncharacterized protein n=1 Tax=Kaistia dalseonensis TaxID=410840 RepID=A0ABU0H9G5_9HYPH|nr:hypothetical protein [Kaistia dalseonensis]MCX5495799.1 hypothetical protein [Kaistia dalseonensis]MDQ0438400.1 hypothetical protein [Kaistia dalseonensis]